MILTGSQIVHNPVVFLDVWTTPNKSQSAGTSQLWLFAEVVDCRCWSRGEEVSKLYLENGVWHCWSTTASLHCVTWRSKNPGLLCFLCLISILFYSIHGFNILGCVILIADVCKQKSGPRCVGNIDFILNINKCMNTHTPIMDASIFYILVFVQVYKKCDWHHWKREGESKMSYSFWSLNCYFLQYPGRAFLLMMLSNK